MGKRNMRRRDFITLLGGAAAAWPVAARAQQLAMPVIGMLLSGSSASSDHPPRAFHHGLSEAGYVEGKNLAIEYRWAGDRNDSFPALAADLVQRGVSVITAIGSPAVAAAKAATGRIPIVFYVGVDPVLFGLVDSLAHPGGNLTGVTNFSLEIGPKRLELLIELLGSRRRVAVLLNPRSRASEASAKSLRSAAQALGLELSFTYAAGEEEFAPRFAELVETGATGLYIGGDPFFNSRAERLGALSLKHALPTIFQTREFTAAGGLVSYGSRFGDQYRLVGVYTGRVLKGGKPVDLPVQQPTTVELIINLKTAKALGITVPLPLIVRADEVIE
jgi:putative ABC transport system substrate-binding protein